MGGEIEGKRGQRRHKTREGGGGMKKGRENTREAQRQGWDERKRTKDGE